jgi:hypothetical protein
MCFRPGLPLTSGEGREVPDKSVTPHTTRPRQCIRGRNSASRTALIFVYNRHPLQEMGGVPNAGSFENYFVAIRGGLHGVVAVGQTRFSLSVDVKILSEHKRTHDYDDDQSLLSGAEEAFLIGS